MNWSILLPLLLVPSHGMVFEEAQPNMCTPSNSTCYYQPHEDCPSPTDQCRCKVDKCKSSMLCCDIVVKDISLTEALICANVNLKTEEITSIHIRNATMSVLNLTELTTWRRTTSLSITDGHISTVVGEFGKHLKISCLNFSSNGIVKFENERSLGALTSMTTLDLSHNNLTEVPHSRYKGNYTLDMSANTLLQCKSVYDTFNLSDVVFINKNTSWCLSSKNFSWFNSMELVSFVEMEALYKLQNICYANCSCEMARFDIVGGQSPKVAVQMNCFGLNLTELPVPLPANTVSLNVSNNKIKSLEPVGNEPSYQSLRQLYADNNEITTILPLEGSKFITNFVALSLKNNHLRTIPTYILSSVFDRNYNAHLIKLGKNKLTCDCNTAKFLRMWLNAKQKQIPDYDEIICENVDSRVKDLDPDKLCQGHHDWTDYIYYIITIEVLLLVCLIAKVSYDYWVFKTTGYLPWPASKMPKLPCDWLCE